MILAALATLSLLSGAHGILKVYVGRDNNSALNPVVQPQNAALAGGGIDQSLEFSDTIYGTSADEMLIGGLGQDVLFGDAGDDILLGGLEHFHPRKSDFIFGGEGDDIVIWAPGDGSDFMDGGPGEDVLVLGLVGETVDGNTVFRVSNDQRAGTVAVNPSTRLPAVAVTNAPGFCTILDRSSARDNESSLDAIGLDHLVRFFLRDEATSFERGFQQTDSGLRQTMHLRNMEALVCTNREGSGYEVFDLTVSPPQRIPLSQLRSAARLEAMLR